tara:strand:+ start:463 stop:687 length:225 start_codon:yes stop_codon:yes gene_type:complete
MCIVNPASAPDTPIVAPPPPTPQAHSAMKETPDIEEGKRETVREEGTGKEKRNTAKMRIKPRTRTRKSGLQIAT